ncbi:MAG: DUF2188 domain-containing protein [Rhodobacteraceae bacterium]|nr:DUF2188 domain-containing protein [Paracoccaceae bacterium]
MTLRVISHSRGWAVKRDGAKRASNVYRTKREAIERKRYLGSRERSRRDGSIMGDYGKGCASTGEDASPTLRVFHGSRGWVVERDGASRASKVFPRKNEAIEWAQDRAR